MDEKTRTIYTLTVTRLLLHRISHNKKHHRTIVGERGARWCVCVCDQLIYRVVFGPAGSWRQLVF